MICLQENCNEKALYGFKQEKPKYCKEHKGNGMVTKSNQYCIPCHLIEIIFLMDYILKF